MAKKRRGGPRFIQLFHNVKRSQAYRGLSRESPARATFRRRPRDDGPLIAGQFLSDSAHTARRAAN